MRCNFYPKIQKVLLQDAYKNWSDYVYARLRTEKSMKFFKSKSYLKKEKIILKSTITWDYLNYLFNLNVQIINITL